MHRQEKKRIRRTTKEIRKQNVDNCILINNYFVSGLNHPTKDIGWLNELKKTRPIHIFPTRELLQIKDTQRLKI